MKKAVILLAEGFEEGESLLTIDILRRAGITCISSSIKDREVKGCNGIVTVVDTLFQNIHLDEYDMLILPGDMPGAQNLADDDRVIDAVKKFMRENKYVAAICAAPMVLKKADVTYGRTLTSYPADKYRSMFLDSNYIDDEIVVKDGNLITSRGPATVFPFAYALAEALDGNVETIKERMLYNKLVESYRE